MDGTRGVMLHDPPSAEIDHSCPEKCDGIICRSDSSPEIILTHQVLISTPTFY
jgi:hypothetical protein